MSSNLTDYTSYDEIRAVLGVSDEELEDGTLALPLYLTMLLMEFDDIEPTLDVQYTNIKALPSRTTQEQKLLDVVSVFSAYAIAQHLLTSLPLFAPKRITDGRAEMDRIADPFESVREEVRNTYRILRARLLVVLGVVPIAVRSRTMFAAVGLGFNTITNI